MVSGFLTSPCDHWRMSSAVARPMRSSSKTLTSSKVPTFFALKTMGITGCEFQRAAGPGQQARPIASGLDLFDRARLAPGQVDAKLLGGTEHVVIGIAHLDRDTVAGQHLDVQAQRLQLLEQHLERLRDARLGDVLALDD